MPCRIWKTLTSSQAEPLSTLAENNFNDRGSSTLSTSSTYSYTLANGYSCALTGWTHTRPYAKGFLRNIPGTGQAVVSGLIKGQHYSYKVYQYASLLASTNPLSVNGIAQADTTSSASDEATATGSAAADAAGSITFAFTRQSDHVHMSGLAIARLPPTQAPYPTYLGVDTNTRVLPLLGHGFSCVGSCPAPPCLSRVSSASVPRAVTGPRGPLKK